MEYGETETFFEAETYFSGFREGYRGLRPCLSVVWTIPFLLPLALLPPSGCRNKKPEKGLQLFL